ncbi:MAG: rod shape-determining protein RodA [Runella slithyformis]|nr:MAG: rod shape-determining protein RodA [Runella slithyformis]TAF01588.1 MAG: rod shape-determining protein RodA [Runella slithyformis]TAF28831.1 MAG: rod shape-determining protein RodA [Runella slithyformis]TAF48948.1 MAG: rod shape-determining protein RodA [Runella slithyformis]TAF83508.1 MAG: rod shape-determining protein RodA [Runella slithyformis]
MARNEANITQSIDWLTVFLYAACVIVGLFNVYAAVYNPDIQTKLFDISNNAGKQAMFAATSVLLITAILVIDHKFWEAFAPIIYGVCIFMLLATLVLATDIKGSRSWIRYGSFQIQPAEFMKIGLALALAKFISQPTVNLTKWRDQLWVAGIVLLPAVLILASKETGLTLVFAAFVIMFYREGLPGIYPALLLTVIGLFLCALFFPKLYIFAGLVAVALLVYWVVIPRYERTRKNVINISVIFSLMAFFVTSVDFIIKHVLQPHMRRRIQVLVDPKVDPTGIGWNVIQSKIAIGSGRMWGKGFLDGTQTKFDFVPEQHTDFIFCTIGEEHGFVGSALVVVLFISLICRIVSLAEKQRTRFARIYGYSVASILFFHFLVNIGMTIGLMPVIGITLPFFSYGGSSLWTFTILLFIFLKLDAQRPFTLSRA